ncbi:S41 family peptidase [Roseivirga sp. BDSF3-8]|uniref:S41 family peptidase n=1 Tax=Roseivirga sp. BDSF3-8 TaxID=3241598 RepID=UPI0035323421
MRNRLWKWSAGALLPVLIITLFSFTSPGERYFEIAKNLDIFATLFKEVNTYYVDEVNPNQLIKAGIDGMLETLDPYTNYIPEDAIEDYRTMTTGQYGGIGAVIGRKNGKNIIIMPYEGFPAYSSGLRIGDELVKVDGIDVTDKNTSDISKLLKGQANTDVELTINRFGKQDPLVLELKREKITIDNVPYYGLVKDDIGYIKLSDFTTGAGKEVKDALSELKEKGAKKVILDLRGNPGGLLSEAINVSNVFVSKGSEIVSTKGKVSDWNKSYKANDNPVDQEIPLVVLTSSRSASAAEIVSGVMQDYDRGVLVGQKTFGKGLVQATRPLTYNSQLKVTTAKYYTPSGRCIQAIDYSHRNEDGSVGKVPDSLKMEFKTTNNRVVYDGGGIDPDVEVEDANYSPISLSLISKGLIFDFATEYYYNNDPVKDSRSFQVNDQLYDQFIKWLGDKDYDYTTKVENKIDELIASAKKEKYYDDIESQIMDLRQKVEHNKESDLQKFKDEVKRLLKEEIVSRYFLEDGMLEASFDYDQDIVQAVEVLDNPSEYNRLLGRN